MTDRAIAMSSPMVRALLDGRKSQTRRLLTKGTGTFGSAPSDFWRHGDLSRAFADGHADSGQYLHVPCHIPDEDVEPPTGHCLRCDEMGWWGTVHRFYPRVAPGDRLWVGEGLRREETDQGVAHKAYAADGVPPMHSAEGWDWKVRALPSRYCPKWASRLTLHVTGVRVERLQDISEADAVAEGAYVAKASGRVADDYVSLAVAGVWFATARGWYADLIDRLHGDGTWADNPWVVALTFEVEACNIAGAREVA